MSNQKPLSPHLVLGTAIVLPGCGQVLNGSAQRGLTFLFFIIVLGWATFRIAPPQATFLGHYAGGLFIYAISIFDAYKWARVRRETWRHAQTQTETAGNDPGRSNNKVD